MGDTTTIEIWDPTLKITDVMAPAPRPASLDGKVLGLLDNTKEKASIFLATLGKRIGRALRPGSGAAAPQGVVLPHGGGRHHRRVERDVRCRDHRHGRLRLVHCVQCARRHHAGAAQHRRGRGVHGGFYRRGGRMQAASLRMPDYPIISVPQHYITSAPDEVRAMAEASVEKVLKRLTAA